jgi:hypothetical protein
LIQPGRDRQKGCDTRHQQLVTNQGFNSRPGVPTCCPWRHGRKRASRRRPRRSYARCSPRPCATLNNRSPSGVPGPAKISRRDRPRDDSLLESTSHCACLSVSELRAPAINLPSCKIAISIIDRFELAAVDRHARLRQQTHLATEIDEARAHPADRRPIVLAEIGSAASSSHASASHR